MTKVYVVTGCYVDKQSNQLVSSIAPISSGISKAGQPYEIADVDSRETIEGQYPVGTRLMGTMSLTVAATDTQGTHSVKLSKD